MKWAGYPKYKKSGVEWLGEVPAHWEVETTRRYLINHKQGYYSAAPYVDEGVRLLRISDFLGDGRMSTSQCPMVEERKELLQYLLRVGDFVFARTGGAGSFAMIEELCEPLAFAAYLIRFRFRNKQVYLPFLRYFFLSSSFQFGIARSIHGGVNQNVHAEDIKDQICTTPPLPEQTTIADFLDRETGRIDNLTAKKRALIGLLKEKRTALISQTVTRGLPADVAREFGLEPHTRFKDSGIEWLGEMPESWKLKRLSYMALLRSGENIISEQIAEGGDYPVFGGNGLRGFYSDYTHNGDYILIGRQGALCGNINYASGKFWASEHAVVLNPLEPFATKWLGELLRAMNLNQYSVSAAQPGLSVSMIGALKVPVPPANEQHAIATFLDRETAKLDTLIQKVETVIERIQEYRTALITAAVTGKIDVRNAVAKKEAA